MKRDPKENELRALIVRAFTEAKVKGKAGWRTMMLGVLKNRLLQSTGRGFRETDYGAKTMRELVEMVPDLLALGEGSQPSVSIRADVAADVADEGNEASDNASGVQAAEAEQDEVIGFQAVLDRYRTNGRQPRRGRSIRDAAVLGRRRRCRMDLRQHRVTVGVVGPRGRRDQWDR